MLTLNFPPSSHSPFFISKIDNLLPRSEVQGQELKATIKLFEAFCSWGTVPNDYRLMTPLVRNSVIAAFIIREMSGFKLGHDPLTKEVLLVQSDKTRGVRCDGLICREDQGPRIPLLCEADESSVL